MILVIGGAGYIGSHTVLYLKEKGEDVIVLDNFSKGHKRALLGTTYYEGELSDEALLDKIFTNHQIDAVIHFAAHSLVGESVKDPLKYYENNLLSTFSLIKKMIQHDVKKIVFSSTAATYGEPSQVPIQESEYAFPTNPYGETKLAMERLMHWCDQSYGLKSISLRYFNAAGADPKGRIGEDHEPETHLIPIVLQAALGQREKVYIYGNDYPTEDGTCIRDYIHVMDLAQAHYLALKRLTETNESAMYNLGNGKGFSVKDVIQSCEKITGKNIPCEIAARRHGDPAILIASSDKAKEELSWEPQYPELDTIINHAWNWHRNNPNGYSS